MRLLVLSLGFFLASCGGGTSVSPKTPGAFGDARRVIGLAAGVEHTCALLATGRVACWGGNYKGQLGDGEKKDRDNARALADVTDAVELVAGGFHSCVRHKSGGIGCWGDGTYGQLGDGTTVERGAGEVAGITDAVQLAAGGHHTCAVRATGQVACWGRNGHGQTGDPRADVSNVPFTIPRIDDAVEVTAGERFSCARRRSGAVTCWGDRPTALGGDQGACDLFTRDLPPAVSKGITKLTAGGGHACAARDHASAVCWGDNRSGELGSKTDVPTCQVVEVSLGDVVELAAGRVHTCARIATGQVACWGDNDRGQLGGGTKHKGTPLPTPVPGLVDADKLVAAHDHTCALRRGGEVVCWGSNQRGELGGEGAGPVTVSVF